MAQCAGSACDALAQEQPWKICASHGAKTLESYLSLLCMQKCFKMKLPQTCLASVKKSCLQKFSENEPELAEISVFILLSSAHAQ